jgi:hypothetical protein
MIESLAFLPSLAHDNLQRPRFKIIHQMNAQLEITHEGKSMCVPISEILNFAQRWNAEFEVYRKQYQPSGHLALYPYPLYSVNLNDPDVVAVDWSA